ncbi:MAG: chromosome segregation protein SMC [Mariniblastus sp.]|nr:chromosome segregation protein SMC [Mariniblastus sp.]
MLKALELTGFKSFADKTRFEFPAGITVVVGPNGSGKSNIVDAIKWVLGEQSAKSLRGKEMADVIFKGAGGANGRKPANSATATIVLDNSDRRFSFDADEVLIGRRVYRSGEAEYLINGDTCRLKDIKNLFRGTGIGTDAYSLIEQGKVDRLLQASPKERRAIFEEAAGISRFKAKKLEAQRRLSRVEGNLIRLADIVEEVGSRYRSVKAQASKASRYKEYTDRLRELRTFVGLKDWRTFTEKLDEIEAERNGLEETADGLTAGIADADKQLKEIEQQLDSFSSEVQEKQEAVTQSRESMAQVESNMTLNRSRLEDNLQRRPELMTQLERAETRCQEYRSRIEENNQLLETSELDYSSANSELSQLDSDLQSLDQQLEEAGQTIVSQRNESGELVGEIAEVGRRVSSVDAEMEQVSRQRTALETNIVEQESALEALQQQHDSFVDERQQLEQQAASKDTALADAKERLTEARENREKLDQLIGSIGNKHSGVTQRTKVLEELEKRLEGVNAGAKELLNQSKVADSGPVKDILGVVADLVSVNVQHAGIVDVALGDVAQYLVVDGEHLLDELATEKLKVKGRVGIIQLEHPPTLGADPNIDMNGQDGVIGRADRLVQVDARFASFVRQLLGGTWVVKTLADALRLYQEKPETVRYVTLDGEIVESDGTVVVGPKSVATGLVSRRSELRSLHRDLIQLKEKLETSRSQQEQVKSLEADCDHQVQKLISENTTLAKLLSDKSVRAGEAKKQMEAISSHIGQLQGQLQETNQSLEDLSSNLQSDRKVLEEREARQLELTEMIQKTEQSVVQSGDEKAEVQKKITKAKVVLAKFEQRLSDIQNRQQQQEAEFGDIQMEAERLGQQLKSDTDSEEKATAEIDALQQELDEMGARRSELEEGLAQLMSRKNELDSSRREMAIQLNSKRDELRGLEDRKHHLELRSGQLNMEREQLAERLNEDYGIDIANVELEGESEEAQQEREAIDEEITQLRKKVGSIGSVNLDALAELEELEARYLAMDEQYQDLVSAKESLEKIIVRINADSRKLFVETLDAIRGNFQKLYRQTFGGGKADIVLEEGVDPLEAGVEIVATPPGKPEFNNSLLSGGEKALTAVSLLMAIFQFRPSPFCVLDEVDAPFDEANIGRFVNVLKSFLDWTKFVIVTHSKKTMTAATTLYGVTMQESGVSKRVSVRFEDVSEDGQISDEALQRGGGDEEAA